MFIVWKAEHSHDTTVLRMFDNHYDKPVKTWRQYWTQKTGHKLWTWVNTNFYASKLSPLPCNRFHVLLNSLFKVLFNFPSRYLFTIGSIALFSLRRSLPSNLACTLEQADSNIHVNGQQDDCALPAFYRRWEILFKDHYAHHKLRRYTRVYAAPRTQLSPWSTLRWAFPFSLAVTRGITFVFFSTASLICLNSAGGHSWHEYEYTNIEEKKQEYNESC